MLESGSLVRKAHESVNMGGSGDMEFMDPAILAVGGRVNTNTTTPPGLDMRSSFPSNLNSFDNNDIRLQLLMQRSFSQQSPHRFTEPGFSYSQPIDSYGVPSRMVDNSLSSYHHQQQQQQQQTRNGQWNGWNEVESGNDISVAELLRNERLGFNRYYSAPDLR